VKIVEAWVDESFLESMTQKIDMGVKQQDVLPGNYSPFKNAWIDKLSTGTTRLVVSPIPLSCPRSH
jgi:hypothetical protein